MQPTESTMEPELIRETPGGVNDPRIYLAAERTFLAWVRTSLSLMGFGFLIARFTILLRESGIAGTPSRTHRAPVSSWLGFAMVCFGVAVCLASLHRHHEYVQSLERGVVNPPVNMRTPLVMAGILALVGLAMAVTILTL